VTLNATPVGMNRNWRCPLGQTFFGLTDEYSEQVYETFFTLKHYGGWSLYELYNLPVGLRQWWLERTMKEYEKEKEQMEKSMKR
jgi:hypothetical protein